MSTRVLITGGAGMLARALARALSDRGVSVRSLDRGELDVTNESAVRAAVAAYGPDIIVQGAAYTRVDDAENDERAAFAVNVEGTEITAAVARAVGARFVYPSTDYVFDGAASSPYSPDAVPSPLNVYGRTKAEGEEKAKLADDFLIIRTGWLYGPGGRNFVRTIVELFGQGRPVRVVNDQTGRPTATRDAAQAIADLVLLRPPAGTYHWCNAGMATWFDLAVEIAKCCGHSHAVTPCTSREFGARAPRPAYSVLDCTATEALIGNARDWRSALREALQTRAY